MILTFSNLLVDFINRRVWGGLFPESSDVSVFAKDGEREGQDTKGVSESMQYVHRYNEVRIYPF